ncbi:MAG: hypothetical protein U0414_33885 [Polyangiaceae bacterium]
MSIGFRSSPPTSRASLAALCSLGLVLAACGSKDNKTTASAEPQSSSSSSSTSTSSSSSSSSSSSKSGSGSTAASGKAGVEAKASGGDEKVSQGDLDKMVDAMCACKDKKCLDDVEVKFKDLGKNDKRKPNELSAAEQKSLERLMDCVTKIALSEPKPDGTGAPKDVKPVDPAVAAKLPDFKALFGSPSDGFLPVVFGKLKKDMSPEEAGKVFPGAEKVDDFGFAKIEHPVNGVDYYEFSYLEKKLAFVDIIFAKTLTGPDVRAAIQQAVEARLPDIKPSAAGSSTMWIDTKDFSSWSLGDTIVDPGFKLQIAVPD